MQSLGRNKPSLDEPVWTNQKPVAGERRERLIRRVAITRRAQGQRLPPALSCVAQLVDPGNGSWSHVANAVARGQRCNMQKQARGSVGRWKRRQFRAAVVTHQRTSSS